MLRITLAFLLAAIAGLAGGCKASTVRSSIINPLHLTEHGMRIVYEAHEFHLDLDRILFGIDYPGGEYELPRQAYYAISAPTWSPID